jgi:hypothetical protein
MRLALPHAGLNGHNVTVLTPRDDDLNPKFGPELTLRQQHNLTFRQNMQAGVVHNLLTTSRLFAGEF